MAKTSIDIQAEKDAQVNLKEARLKQSIKEHNVRAALKTEKKNRPDSFIGKMLGFEKTGHTDKSKSLVKELRKTKKTQKFINKAQDRLDEKGVGSTAGRIAKKRLEAKLPSTEGSFRGGGRALRGLGKAFMKGGKVK